jgi:tetratricopeptide (TPR) repeat protein
VDRRRPDWPGARVELRPLLEGESEAIASTLAPNLDPAARARAAEAAEGNPLFLEQLLALASEHREELALPHTIQGLLAARLDQLEANERALLERAAVIGKEFWRAALVDLSPRETEVSALLQRLVRKRLIHPERSNVPGEDAFRFGHILIRDAVYAAMPKAERSTLHERFADWLEQAGSPYEEIVAYHLEQACRFGAELRIADGRTQALAVRAAEKLGAAGESALARNDLSAAVNLLTRATALHEAGAPRRLDLLIELGAAMFPFGDARQALAVLDEALEQASAAREPALEWRARLERNYVVTMLEPSVLSNEAELRTAEEAIRALEGLGDDRALARAWRSVTQGRFWLGRNESSLEASEHALDYARRAGDRQVEVWALRSRAMALCSGPRPAAEAAKGCEEIIAAAENEEITACALENLGTLRAIQGRAEEARQLIDRALAIYRELGLVFRQAVTLGFYRAHANELAGDFLAAERDYRCAIDFLESIGDKSARSTVAARLAGTLYALGRYAEAEQQVNLAEQLASIDDLETMQQAWSVRAKLLARQGELERGKAAAEKALGIAESTDDLNGRGRMWMDKAEVLSLAAEPVVAASCLERGIELFEQKGNVVTARHARHHLNELAVAEELRTSS